MRRIIYKQSTLKEEEKTNKGLYQISIKDMTEMALFVALAVVLDRFVKIPLGPTAGSLNISVAPLMIICLRHGYYKGFLASGVIYGIVTSMLDAYGFQYFFFDYLLAFGSVCVLGLFAKLIYRLYKDKKVLSFLLVALGGTLWLALRVVFASFDSMIFYHYTFIAGVVYNVSYAGLSALADVVIVCILLPVIITINKIFKTSFVKEL